MKLFEFTEELINSTVQGFLEKVGSYQATGVKARISLAFILDIAHVVDTDSEQKLVNEINELLQKYLIPLTVKYIDMKRKEVWFNENTSNIK